MKINCYHFDSIDSTNVWAKKHCSTFEKDTLTVISADSQSAGRGRWGRNWLSSARKGAYVSLVMHSDVKPFWISQLTALVLQKLLSTYSIDAKIKWPNDLLVNDHKISGILIERTEGFFIIGIGLNINQSPDDLKNVSQKATSMAIETKEFFNVQKIIQALVESFINEYEKAVANGFIDICKSWHEKVQWMLYKPVSVQTATGKLEGRLKALHFDGSLQVETQSGSVIDVHSADTLQL